MSISQQLPLRLLAVGLFLCSLAPLHANMIRNWSFEEEAPSSSRNALYWSMDEPDAHGDAYGNASREDWRSFDGMHIMTVRGTWAEAGDYGGIWQEASAESGETYRASAWFWADPDWEPALQEMKLEFFSENHTELLKTETVRLRGIESDWERREIQAQAPDETAWVRLVIHVEGVGETGALQIDSVYMNTDADFDEPASEPVDVIIDVLQEDDEDE